MSTPITITVETMHGGQRIVEQFELLESELGMLRYPRDFVAGRTLEAVDNVRKMAGREALEDERV